MSEKRATPSGRERTFASHELIVSKTDPKGRLTYVNDVFLTVSGFVESELIGQPHSVIRHPEMPRCVFKLLWDAISSGKELFAYVNNMSKNGDNYWVFAHVTPSFDANGQIVGYHSNRRIPEPAALDVIKPLYKTLMNEENRHQDRKAGLESAWAMLHKAVADAGFDSYDRFIFAITPDR